MSCGLSPESESLCTEQQIHCPRVHLPVRGRRAKTGNLWGSSVYLLEFEGFQTVDWEIIV